MLPALADPKAGARRQILFTRWWLKRLHADCVWHSVLGASETLRVIQVQNLVPAGERIGEFPGDDALEVGVDHGLVERASFADDAVGERDPALDPIGSAARLAIWASLALRSPSGSGR